MTSYQKTNAVAGSTQEVIKVQYTAKTHTSGGRHRGVSRSGTAWALSIYNGAASNGHCENIRMWTIKPKPLERDQ